MLSEVVGTAVGPRGGSSDVVVKVGFIRRNLFTMYGEHPQISELATDPLINSRSHTGKTATRSADCGTTFKL